jgi:hypothetical protein
MHAFFNKLSVCSLNDEDHYQPRRYDMSNEGRGREWTD